ncbi:MAG: cyclic nucleotide-binding domain-containing protein [Verrucomicrobiota bacterium]
MKLLTGYALADLLMNKSSYHREVGPGEVIFKNGAPASGLFIVLEGKVEIIKTTETGGMRVGEVGPHGVFGEMGLIREGGVRAATARALEPSLLLEMRNNPIQMLQKIGEINATIVLLKRMICVLGEWLRSQIDASGTSRGLTPVPPHRALRDREASDRIKEHLPKGFFQLSPKRMVLPDGQYLCRQGERPDGFYFIHKGTLEVLKQEIASPSQHKIGELYGPTVAGEVGYFSGEPRLVSLQAFGEVVYTHFSGEDFEKLEEKHPDRALEVLLAAAQLIVCLVRNGTDPA